VVGDSEYIIFVDESGTPMTTSVDKDFPIFSLQFLVITKHEYARIAVPEIVGFKMKHHGSDSVILHGSRIHRREGEFEFLNKKSIADTYYLDLDAVVAKIPMRLHSAFYLHREVSRLDSLIVEKPYALFLHRLLSEVVETVSRDGYSKTRCRVVIESRRDEDARMLASFEAYQEVFPSSKVDFELEMVSKERNLPGLQLVDLVATPVAQSCIPGSKESKSWATVATKVIQKSDLTSELRFRLNESQLS
jgi:hypothetical protein